MDLGQHVAVPPVPAFHNTVHGVKVRFVFVLPVQGFLSNNVGFAYFLYKDSTGKGRVYVYCTRL